jgi:4-hydroxy-tetrahydrodipicolinate synthase
MGHDVGDSRYAVSFTSAQCEEINHIIAKYIS